MPPKQPNPPKGHEESADADTPASESVRRHIKMAMERAGEGAKGKQRGLAPVLKVSQAYISDVVNGKRSGIPKLAQALATYLKLPYEQVIGKSVVVELDPRYPNRARAIEMASEGLGIDLAHAERLAPRALDADEDPEIFWWLDQIRSRHSAEKKGLRLGVQEVTDDD